MMGYIWIYVQDIKLLRSNLCLGGFFLDDANAHTNANDNAGQQHMTDNTWLHRPNEPKNITFTPIPNLMGTSTLVTYWNFLNYNWSC